MKKPPFQDRNIEWGKHWPDTLEKALAQSTFLMPIVRRSYFESSACRKELETFIEYEQHGDRRDRNCPSTGAIAPNGKIHRGVAPTHLHRNCMSANIVIGGLSFDRSRRDPQVTKELECTAKQIADLIPPSPGFRGILSRQVLVVVQQAKVVPQMYYRIFRWRSEERSEGWRYPVAKRRVFKAINRARMWVHELKISSDAVNFKEEGSLKAFLEGKAAFLRSWPYAYATLKKQFGDRLGVAPLPRSKHYSYNVGVLGGAALAVSERSRKRVEALKFVNYMTSNDVETWRAQKGSYVPRGGGGTPPEINIAVNRINPVIIRTSARTRQ